MVLILIAHGMNGNSNNANVFTVMTPGNSKLVRCQRKAWVCLGVKACEVFHCFVAIVRARVFYVVFFVFFVLRHW